jgi:putative membrane protein
VAGLRKDANGVWRGTAMKDGSSKPVSVDYQGNVN